MRAQTPNNTLKVQLISRTRQSGSLSQSGFKSWHKLFKIKIRGHLSPGLSQRLVLGDVLIADLELLEKLVLQSFNNLIPIQLFIGRVTTPPLFRKNWDKLLGCPNNYWKIEFFLKNGRLRKTVGALFFFIYSLIMVVRLGTKDTLGTQTPNRFN